MREDYSPDGYAWEFLTHDMARSKAYRWGEDGIAGICDRYQLLVFALALLEWPRPDPEGADVRALRQRRQSRRGRQGVLVLSRQHAHPQLYADALQVSASRVSVPEVAGRKSSPLGQAGFAEYELLDTGIFDEDRYFDVFVEYAKAGPEDICIRIEAINRGPEAADLHLLPHLWFRNTWAWTDPPTAEPDDPAGQSAGNDHLALVADDSHATACAILQFPYSLGTRYLYAPAGGEPLFTDNETNAVRLYGCASNRKPYVKDAFHRHIVNHEDCVNPARRPAPRRAFTTGR